MQPSFSKITEIYLAGKPLVRPERTAGSEQVVERPAEGGLPLQRQPSGTPQQRNATTPALASRSCRNIDRPDRWPRLTGVERYRQFDSCSSFAPDVVKRICCVLGRRLCEVQRRSANATLDYLLGQVHRLFHTTDRAVVIGPSCTIQVDEATGFCRMLTSLR